MLKKLFNNDKKPFLIQAFLYKTKEFIEQYTGKKKNHVLGHTV